jgi:hypothetical protein
MVNDPEKGYGIFAENMISNWFFWIFSM